MWRSIGSAPLDGTLVLLRWSEDRAEVGYFGVNHPNQQGRACWRATNGNKLWPPVEWTGLPGMNAKHWTAR